MVGQVVVDPARCDGPRPDERERRERARMIESGDLGHHAADPDARQVCRPVVESAGEGGGVGGEFAQRVRRRLGIDGRRRAGVAQVVAHDVTSAASEGLAQRVGPGQHRRAARQQHERRCRIAEVLHPEPDALRRTERAHRRLHRCSSIRCDSVLCAAPGGRPDEADRLIAARPWSQPAPRGAYPEMARDAVPDGESQQATPAAHAARGTLGPASSRNTARGTAW